MIEIYGVEAERHLFSTISHLKIKILVQDQGGAEF